MKSCIWYVSKYVAPPAKVGAGGRGYLIMREFARMGYQSVIITSDSNQLTEVPVLEEAYLFQEVDGMRLCWVRTMKYAVAKSLRRILSWLDFEWRLWRLPKDRLPAPDVVQAGSSGEWVISASNQKVMSTKPAVSAISWAKRRKPVGL